MQRMTPEDVVMVPVPRGALPLVYKVLHEYCVTEQAPQAVIVPGSDSWTLDELRKLKSVIQENTALQTVLRTVAKAKGKRVPYGKLADAAGVQLPQLRSLLAWLSKYGAMVKGTKSWPMSVVSNSTLPARERHQHLMPPQIAEWWLALDNQEENQ